MNMHLLGESSSRNLGGFGGSLGYDCRRAHVASDDDDDVVDLLPQDPFDMDIESTVIADWIEDIEMDLGLEALGFVTDEIEVGDVDDHVLAELGFVFNGCKMDSREKNGVLFLDCKMEENFDINYGKYLFFDGEFDSPKGSPGAPHDALFLALYYLNVEDLLSVEQVCKSLRDAVQNDSLIWRRINIEQPLSEKITDESLLQLTNRAQGQLQCLNLVECLKITDSGLRNVFENNRKLTKLSVAGCMKLSIDGLLSTLKVSKDMGNPGLQCLRIGGLYGITNQHYDELKLLLGLNSNQAAHKPRFYRGSQVYLSVDDERAIDVETCPKCQQMKLVYDCPAKGCQEKKQGDQLCRACIVCVSRCKSCGRCLSNCDYEETFCLEYLCSGCIQKILPRPFFHPQASYHFFIRG